MLYIHDRPEWPHFSWDRDAIARQLSAVHIAQGLLIGKMGMVGFNLSETTVLESLTEEIQKSNEIEGERLDRAQVRSSIARKLGMEAAAILPADRNLEGVVEMMIDATQRYDVPLTRERLFGWHRDLFPTGKIDGNPALVGAWRDDSEGRMQVTSRLDEPAVHYVAPEAHRLDAEMAAFLTWFEHDGPCDPVLQAAIAHLWFVTIHPFVDGNGRIGRAISDMALARSEQSPKRFYSMSAQLRKKRREYYDILELTQKGEMDIASWLEWFLTCLLSAIKEAEAALSTVLAKAQFWQRFAEAPINERQKRMLNMLLDGFEGKLNNSKWSKITKCSADTALRDITDLVSRKMLVKEEGGGRNTSYSVVKGCEA